jgi:succinate dehydrogenase / fumarate reductase cytochrome b subunit
MEKVIKNITKQRPKFLNLLQIRLPITAVASILHRITGVILLLVLPVVIYGLGLSLQDEKGFQEVMMAIKSPAFQFLLVLIATSVFYHFLAGIRFLLLDMDIGHEIVVARWSARIVIIVSTIILILLVAGVFAS